MKVLIFLYKLVCVSLIVLALGIELLILASLVSRGRIIQYAEPGPRTFDDQLYNYFIDDGQMYMLITFLSGVY